MLVRHCIMSQNWCNSIIPSVSLYSWSLLSSCHFLWKIYFLYRGFLKFVGSGTLLRKNWLKKVTLSPGLLSLLDISWKLEAFREAGYLGLESKRGDPPCTPRLFGVLVLRAQKELNKSLEDGHRKKIALFVRLLFFFSRMGFGHPKTVIHSCEIMWNHVKIQIDSLRPASCWYGLHERQERLWGVLDRSSRLLRCLPGLQITWNSCEIMWNFSHDFTWISSDL